MPSAASGESPGAIEMPDEAEPTARGADPTARVAGAPGPARAPIESAGCGLLEATDADWNDRAVSAG